MLLAVLTIVSVGHAPADANPQSPTRLNQTGTWEIVLKEHLNRQWTDEPLSYTFEAPQGIAHVDSLRLEGPAGPAAFQLDDVTLWDGTQTIRSATLWLVADLEPLATNLYTLHYAPDPSGRTDGDGAAVREDLQITASETQVEMTTSRFGVRARLGSEQYTQPRAAANVPSPVVAMRLADGTWFGGSEMYGPTGITAWSSELVASGPIFGEVRYRYSYDNGNALTFVVRQFARSNRVQFDMDIEREHLPDGLRIYLDKNLAPLTLHLQKRWSFEREGLYPNDAKYGDWFSVPVADLDQYPPRRGPVNRVQAVSPWAPWWNDMNAPVVRLGIGDGERELHIARRDPAAWVKPMDGWGHSDGAPAGWAGKAIDILTNENGDVYLEVDLRGNEKVGGVRKFDIADSEPRPQVGWRSKRRDHRGDPGGSQVLIYEEPLNVVKDYVLEWPSEKSSPRMFMSAEEIEASRPETVDPELITWLEQRAGSGPGPLPHSRDNNALALWLLTGDDEVARERGMAERLKNHLGLLADFDKMRSTVHVAALYDALIDSDLITPDERRLLRAQMAYLAYVVAHPATWSPERGWNSGNLNMTVSYSMLGNGAMAAVLSDHPEAQAWMEPARYFVEQLLNILAENGEWPESANYANLAVGELLTFAIMATRGGFGDYLNDPRLRSAVTQLTKIKTPPDPRIHGERNVPTYGRSSNRPWALDGAMARATLSSDPEFSRQMQWVWMDVLDHGDKPLTPAMRLSGFEYLYLDPSLPASPPDWMTELFPKMGALLRHGFATNDEHYHMLLGGDHLAMIYPSQLGTLISMHAYGMPVAGSFFGRYGYQNEFLSNGVSLARRPQDYVANKTPFDYRGIPRGDAFYFEDDRPQADFERQQPGDGNVSAFAALPRQDYAAVDVAMILPQTVKRKIPDDIPWPQLVAGDGEPPLWWRRQTLFLKDPDPSAAGNYLIVRDTVKGDQPTMWTLWTASQRLGTADEAANRDSFLADAPGNQIVEPRALYGDRFTAVGQFGVDLEFYVASPTETPRHTLRWGTTWNETPWDGLEQYQDLLHLQQADDGVYFVALYPRKADTAGEPLAFSTLGDGKVIKVEGSFGIDWAYLSGTASEAAADGLHFRGKAASVQHRGGETALSLGEAGGVATEAVQVESDAAVMLNWQGAPHAGAGNGTYNVTLPAEHEGVILQLQLPTGDYAASDESVTVVVHGGTTNVTVPAAVTTFTLHRQ